MQAADYEGARASALGRLAGELSPRLIYHSVQHTRDEVLPAAGQLAAELSVTGEDLMLLLTAACFHDLGFLERYDDNEILAARIASQVLPRFGYDERQIDTVSCLILATRLPQAPCTLPAQILADADLDGLGREDFFRRSDDLRREQEIYRGRVTDAEWYAAQLVFLRSHRYFTAAAERLRADGKQRNITRLESLLAQLRMPG